jgi:RNA polymerase sigma-70 factor (ECF subfamily)
MSEEQELIQLVRSAQGGDGQALARLCEQHRERLARMVRLRLDRRLSGRVQTDDVLRQAFSAASGRLGEYQAETLPFFLWLRQLTGEELRATHQRLLGAPPPADAPEVSLYRGALPAATSGSLAAQLLGKMTSETEAAVRAEHKLFVQEALNSMDAVDREVLVLRHLEQLSNDETALVLDIKRSAASQRYIRALKRLKEIVSAIPGALRDEG